MGAITTDKEYFKKYGHDKEEVMKDQMIKLEYPAPFKKYRLIYETYQNSIEETYFWILNYMRYDLQFAHIEKITDIFSATETSAFGGVTQQRVGLTQDKISQFLATIGKMTKELFQLVRELRILDERMDYYEESFSDDPQKAGPADITLKGVYIDMAEGGSKSPASVYGMARELQFTTLPDLFFTTRVSKTEEIEGAVDKLEFNKAVKTVLKRKLHSYLKWRDHTYKEIKGRRIFTLKYLKQHYETIKMYMSWVKPYLRRVRRLQGKEQALDDVELINAFESSMIEIEILGVHKPKDNAKVFGCFLISFDYTTKPSMNYQAEGYQRGPLHIGQIKMKMRAYSWTQEDIDNYKSLREREDFELLKSIDESVRTAMESLGGELEKYLAEAGEDAYKKEEKKPEKKIKLPNVFEPFAHVFKGATEAVKAVTPNLKSDKPSARDKYSLEGEKKKAKSFLNAKLWLLYKNYKKAHKMLAW